MLVPCFANKVSFSFAFSPDNKDIQGKRADGQRAASCVQSYKYFRCLQIKDVNNCCRSVHSMSCFATSHTTMPAVTLTLSECFVPNCGISMQPSEASTTS